MCTINLTLSLEDVLKARVITTGPEEHVIRAEAASENSKEWTIYDVGGCRSQRGENYPKTRSWYRVLTRFSFFEAVWAQFFDNGIHISLSERPKLKEGCSQHYHFPCPDVRV